nr:immunoglobulin light chain junction region [Macaca mulatta]MOV73137.1 immunoglobulin light chain junction region [Macaca mulatta]MOV73625.1 immunoglobulin light chain junction region [Macaca mulatta]
DYYCGSYRRGTTWIF